jgi:hypothetical protein
MALLTDGNPCDVEALRAYETSILDVAKTERIDLDTKLGLAAAEVSEAVLNVLLDHADISDPQSLHRRQTGTSDVVVTSQLKRWHAYHTLAIVYQDAFNNQLNDRYRAKWNQYQELARNAREDTMRFGIGLASNPIPKGAQPLFGYVAGLVPATTYWAQLSWVTATGQEGAPGELAAYQTPEGSLVSVAAPGPPAVATGFNVYLGISPTGVTLQNATAIPVGQTFTLPPTGLVAGTSPGSGQAPDRYVVGGQMLRRG